ncbi:hypothetical protein AAMO2058_000760700 [Amorphochlora amoebiformis]
MIILFLAALHSAAGAHSPPSPTWDGSLHWTAIPLGAGVGNLVQCPVNSPTGKDAFLVDLGRMAFSNEPPWSPGELHMIRQYLSQAKITHIFVSNSEPQSYNLLPIVFNNPKTQLKDVKEVLIGGHGRQSFVAAFQVWLTQQPGNVTFVNDKKPCISCKTWTSAQGLCPTAPSSFSLEVIAANMGVSINARSLVLQAAFSGRKILLPGGFQEPHYYATLINTLGRSKLKSDILSVAYNGRAGLANTQVRWSSKF